MTDNLELDELSESAVLDDEPILKKDVGMYEFDIPSSASDVEAVYDIPVKVSAILGKSKMKDWKAAVRNWNRSQRQGMTANGKKSGIDWSSV